MSKIKRKYYRKLIRDRIPEIIKKDGYESITSVLNIKKFQAELKRKFIEESKELIKAKNKKDITEELADVLELIETLSESLGVPRYALERIQREKRSQRGGFKKRLYLLATLHKG